jgi:hypothetical protein
VKEMTFLWRSGWAVQHLEALRSNGRAAYCGIAIEGPWWPSRADVPINTKPICAHCVSRWIAEG